MKVLAIVLVAFVVAQAAAWDLSKYQPRSVLFPRAPTKNTNSFVPVKRSPTVDTRGFCGQAKSASRIVGGTEAVPNSLPWQVALFIDDKYFCGGSLISNEWVMTAAHCADGAVFFNILLGSHNVRLAAADEPTRVEVTSFDYTVHPDWASLRIRNDVALIKLPAPIEFTPEIQPICMAPSTEPDHVGDILHNSGWGKPSDAAAGISPTLNEVYMPCMSNDECAAYFGNTIQPGNICTDTTGGHSACNGDSGGPLSYINGGVYNQVGIVSFGSSAGCEVGYPAAYTRVSYYADWISSVTGLVI
ncbi:chymotrypsin-like protein [Daphnia pulex]|uniref:Chymotrypsin-like protein n=1 Tax=Daphnia pulex TaxID=6669 RepID=E9GLZ0_DAPPU|nr:chymotrypsin-like protein [Daphnia pulex]|eukprot:EFX79603.1 chymotrypsin-like protein [Daphnia pulex]